MACIRLLSVVGLVLVAACTARQPPQPAPQAATDVPAPAVPAPSPPPTTTPPPGGQPSAEPAKLQPCPTKRPQICTQQYQPVCATVDTGIRCIKAPCPSSETKEYSNWCVACTDPKVTMYVEGPCPGGGPRPSPESMPQ